MSPQLQASLEAFDEMFEHMARFIGELDEEVVNWRPPIADANTIAALVTHTCGSTNSWLARAVGETIARDRDAEFREQASAPELVRTVERTRAEVKRRIALLEGRELSHTLTVTRAGGAHAGRTVDVTLAWCIEHALVHAGEHWGHIQLTRQLHAARG